MAISITPTTGLSTAGVPRVSVAVAWTDTPIPATVTVYRIDPDGHARAVRAGDPLTLNGSGAGSVVDYEAPFDKAVSYRVANADGTKAANSAAITLVSNGVPWLVHPGKPDLSRPLLVASWPSWSRPIVRGLFQPIGRKYPIAVSSRARSGESGDLTVYTAGSTENGKVLALLADGSPLLLKGTSKENAGTRWVSIGDVSEEPSEDSVLGTFTTWTLPLTAVEAPPGAPLSSLSYADNANAFLSYADALSKAPTYGDRAL